MELHRGRLIDHVHLRTRDIDASKRFYRAVLKALGLVHSLNEREKNFWADELYVDVADGEITRVHLAFQAPDRETGGRDNGAPGERSYHPGYYAAFALDPDGNNIEVVYHGPGERTAASVVVTAADIA
jgi:catechol 2,3-dioxygenase-like lactoylglutathione lyase family enzyme